ncbi:MAG: bifunctional oligoribonuclease/PAP phosphatase NrnA [Clostridiales bacterium]|nr:bifunctional oligoribonuclease/PAP phosphatase NrnA [Clostridiales bacterium]
MKKIAKKFKKSDNIAVFVHTNPDGDAVGSIVAFSTALKNMGKNVDVFIENKPEYLSFIIDDSIKLYSELDFDKKYDLCVALDCGDKERIGDAAKVFDNAEFTIELDHHKTNDNYANLSYVDATASATGEIIYELLKIMKVKITKEIAEALYIAIISDTGMFKHQNTTSKTFEIASKLVAYGIDISTITHKLFYENSFERTKCLGDVLNTLETYLDGKVGILYLTREMMQKYDLKETELDGFVEYARNIKGVEIGIFIKQKTDTEYKVSLRANSDADMSKIAEKFNGGGHKGAAGCRFENKTIEEIKIELLNEIKK